MCSIKPYIWGPASRGSCMKKFRTLAWGWLLIGALIAPNDFPLATHDKLAPPTEIPDREPEFNFLESVQDHFLEAASTLRVNLNYDTTQALLQPDRTIEVTFPVIMDNGETQTFTGWRVQHSFLKGPAKGGIRVMPGLTMEDVQALATEMTLKTAIGLPLGGAKGGIDAEYSKLSQPEYARLMRGYVRAVMDKVWKEHKDIAFHILRDSPAPDHGTNAELMNVAVDEHLKWLVEHRREYQQWLKLFFNSELEERFYALPESLNNDLLHSGVINNASTSVPYLKHYMSAKASGEIPSLGLIGAFTGKKVGLGGSQGRDGATGLGIAYAALEMVKHDKGRPSALREFQGETVAVQGFGNVGSGAVRAFTKLGAKVTAIAEFDPYLGIPFGIVKESGFTPEDIGALESFKKEHGTLIGSSVADKLIGLDQFWELDVEILAPSATQGQITARNAKKIKARYIVEGANGPTTPTADKILWQRGIRVIPDIFANAGGVTVSYFEMEQNRYGEFWSEEQVEEKLYQKMRKNFSFIKALSGEDIIPYREAAFIFGLIKLKEKLTGQKLKTEEQVHNKKPSQLKIPFPNYWAEDIASAI